MDRGVWWVTARGVVKESDMTEHAQMRCWLIYHVLISAVRQSISVTLNVHVYILFYIPFHCGLLWDIEYSSLCYIVGPCFSLSSYLLLSPPFLSTRDNQVAGWVRVVGSDH